MACGCNQTGQAQAFEQIAAIPNPLYVLSSGNDKIKPDSLSSTGYLGTNNYFVQLARALARYKQGIPNLFAGQIPADVLPSAAEIRENAWIRGQLFT